jgi:hypothetical protein
MDGAASGPGCTGPRPRSNCRLGPRPCFLQIGLDGRAGYDDPRLHGPSVGQVAGGLPARTRLRHPLHGGYYRGNLLAAHNDPTRLIAVLDSDEALVAPPEVEVAGTATEFTGEFCQHIADARHFADTYLQGGKQAPSSTSKTRRWCS